MSIKEQAEEYFAGEELKSWMEYVAPFHPIERKLFFHFAGDELGKETDGVGNAYRFDDAQSLDDTMSRIIEYWLTEKLRPELPKYSPETGFDPDPPDDSEYEIE
jgi:hypothetical protein